MSELKIMVASLDLRPLGLLQLRRLICGKQCVETCTGSLQQVCNFALTYIVSFGDRFLL